MKQNDFIGFRATKEERDKLEKLATATERNKSQIMRLLIREALERPDRDIITRLEASK